MNTARDLLAEIARHHVHIERHGSRLHMRASAPPPADLLQRIRQRKPELLAVLPDADQRAIVRWRAPNFPPGSWCVAIGAPGLPRERVVSDLLNRWPDSEVQA